MSNVEKHDTPQASHTLDICLAYTPTVARRWVHACTRTLSRMHAAYWVLCRNGQEKKSLVSCFEDYEVDEEHWRALVMQQVDMNSVSGSFISSA
jgi:hypothetical protein